MRAKDLHIALKSNNPAEDMKLKELKAIARLKVMVEEYERMTLKVEIDFENPKAKQLFEFTP